MITEQNAQDAEHSDEDGVDLLGILKRLLAKACDHSEEVLLLTAMAGLDNTKPARSRT